MSNSSERAASAAETSSKKGKYRSRKLIAGVALTAVAATATGAYGAVSYEGKLSRRSAAQTATLRQQGTAIQELQGQNAQSAKQINELSTLMAGLTGSSKEAIERKKLRPVSELAGYGQEVSEADKQRMRAATVKVVERPKNSTAGQKWLDNCTGLKVLVGGQPYVATARHCFMYSYDESRAFPLKGGGDYSTQKLFEGTNVTKVISNQFGVESIAADNVTRGSVAPVSEAAVTYFPDWALLKIDQKSPAAAAFNAQPAIDYDQSLTAMSQPGASSIVYSMPEASNGKLLEASGVFLGRVTDPDQPSRMMDLIGIDPKIPAEDACNYGSSGSSAIIAGRRVTGPLTMRNNIGYAPGAPSNEPDDPKSAVTYRLQLEQLLGIDTADFSTICGYSVDMGNSAATIARGFANPMQLSPIPSTGGMK